MHVVHVLPTCSSPCASLNVYVYVNRPPEQYNMLNGLSLASWLSGVRGACVECLRVLGSQYGRLALGPLNVL